MSLEAQSAGFTGAHSQAIARVMASALLLLVGSMMIVVVFKANIEAAMLDEQAIHLEAGALNAVSNTAR